MPVLCSLLRRESTRVMRLHRLVKKLYAPVLERALRLR
jgi:hypothetical protein